MARLGWSNWLSLWIMFGHVSTPADITPQLYSLLIPARPAEGA